MSLSKAIQFRHLTAQLTQQEHIQFLSNLLDTHTDIILTSLFEYLAQSHRIHQANAFNESLTDIIQSRKEKPKPIPTTNVTLSQFPRAIIGHLASFLNQSDYNHFGMSNRFIYLGCNSPNMLQELDLSPFDVAQYSSINLSSFPSVKTLIMDPSTAIESQLNLSVDSQPLNQVTTLWLNANQKCDWVKPFLRQKIVNCANVTTLKCVGIGTDDWTQCMDKDEFLTLLREFSNLTEINLTNVGITNDITAQEIADIHPNVDALIMLGCSSRLSRDLTKIFGNQLKHLVLQQYQKNEFDFSDVSFSKLEELCIGRPGNRVLDSILKSAPNFKKLWLQFWSTDNNGFMNHDDIKKTIGNVMDQCKSLQYMHLAVKNHHFCSILDGIECGLFKIKQQERTKIKILIDLHEDQCIEAHKFMLNIGRIINALETSSIHDFMFIWKLDGINKDKVKEIFMNVCNLSANSKVFREKACIIITNENCKINGYCDSVCGLRPTL
eukprot:1140917_1